MQTNRWTSSWADIRSDVEEDDEWHHEGLSFLFITRVLHDVCKDDAIAYISIRTRLHMKTHANRTTSQFVVDQKVLLAIKRKG